MTEQSDEEREAVFEDVIREGEEAIREVEDTLPDLMRRLDRVSADLRARGAFPVASQIERRRPEGSAASHG